MACHPARAEASARTAASCCAVARAQRVAQAGLYLADVGFQLRGDGRCSEAAIQQPDGLRFALEAGRPALAGLESVRHGAAELDRDEGREAGELVEAAMVKPPARIAALLDAPKDAPMLCRRRLVRQDGEASEVITWWVPAALAEGTDLASPEPLTGGIRSHLARRKAVANRITPKSR